MFRTKVVEENGTLISFFVPPPPPLHALPPRRFCGSRGNRTKQISPPLASPKRPSVFVIIRELKIRGQQDGNRSVYNCVMLGFHKLARDD